MFSAFVSGKGPQINDFALCPDFRKSVSDFNYVQIMYCHAK